MQEDQALCFISKRVNNTMIVSFFWYRLHSFLSGNRLHSLSVRRENNAEDTVTLTKSGLHLCKPIIHIPLNEYISLRKTLFPELKNNIDQSIDFSKKAPL